MIDHLQFYPTPPDLARRAWAKFQRPIVRVLEPSAGNGDLAAAAPGTGSRGDWYRERPPIDCIEIDITRHARLREAGYPVVGLDFLQFGQGANYSHIIMNPSFRDGVHHVLKAWQILWDGEIVAIVNAETVRNPNSKERQLLTRLIERHGSVEYIESAFTTEETQRKADVTVALIYLRKESAAKDITGTILEDLERDRSNAESLADGYVKPQEIALPSSTIENAVLAFQAAAQAARELVFAEARAQRYARLLGNTMAVSNGTEGAGEVQDKASIEYVQRTLHTRYEELKDRAWTGVLRSSRVTDRLSSAGQKQVEAQFEQIKTLEFTVRNIYGFLQGIVDNQGEIQLEMLCSVFDEITKYHTDNAVFYKGWKSNDRHRTTGMRVKMTRFVLPRHHSTSYSGLDWDSRRLLADFDKVFAMLDGKVRAEYGIVDAFEKEIGALRGGERVRSSYFDLRHYPGAGTIHFFPRNRELIDRLNRVVGQHRRWLPPQDVRVSENFWLQYEQAEKFDKSVRKAVQASSGQRSSYYTRDAYHAMRWGDDAERLRANAAIATAIDSVLESRGIDTEFRIESGPEQPRLTAA